jgi:glutamine amidotransferase-like uncharacterized protein
MAMSSKVFIYNAQGASASSAEDLKELFTSENIFVNRPDVQLSDFNFNPSGLNTPTFVVPGGSTTQIGTRVKPQISKIRSTLGDNFNYVGVCAGAFIGTRPADLFFTTHKYSFQNGGLEEPVFFLTTEDNKVNLDFITDYKAVGSFYPHDGHKHSTPKTYMPYRVNLSLTENNSKLSQLYVAGPGFIPVNDNGQSSVVATYTDCESYMFPYEKESTKVNHFPAIISSKPSEDKGGVFLSGTHIEACVPNSRFLTFFKTAEKHNSALKAEEYDAFVLEQAETRATVESLLSKTLK